jgi:hypothetical protein
MSGFVPTLLICVGASLVFAYIGLLVVRSAPKLVDAKGDTSFQLGPVKVSTGSVLIAYFVIAGILMVGIPAYWLYTSNARDDAPVTFETHLRPAPTKLDIASLDFGPAQFSQFRVYRSSSPQHFIISAPDYDPVDVEAYYDWSNRRLEVIIEGRTYHVPIDGARAALADAIPLHRAEIPGKQLAHDLTLTQSNGVTPKERAAADPPAQRQP